MGGKEKERETRQRREILNFSFNLLFFLQFRSFLVFFSLHFYKRGIYQRAEVEAREASFSQKYPPSEEHSASESLPSSFSSPSPPAALNASGEPCGAGSSAEEARWRSRACLVSVVEGASEGKERSAAEWLGGRG